jgi:ring-1,2-phenylacetyl-CoA epoxidase subunit PaaE
LDLGDFQVPTKLQIPSNMSKQFYKLVVKEIKRETPDAVSVSFTVPEELKETFQYTQGQFLTLKFQIKGQEVRRSYSMCSSPLEENLTVTVKKVKSGVVSCYIHDNLQPGQTVEVMPPEGRFFTKLEEEQRKTYYLFGAGSGITPLFSILKTILEKEPQNAVFLLYGNRDEESIIFREALEELQRRYEGQLHVEHILSRPRREKPKGLGGIFSKGVSTWPGKTGRISAAHVNEFMEENPPRSKEVECFICGPGDMIDVVKAALTGRGIGKEHIHTEHFSAGIVGKGGTAKQNGAQIMKGMVKVHLEGQLIEIEVPPGKTILDTLIDEGYDPPYSCTSGACSTCMAKVLKGSVTMDACFALDSEEVEEGYILTCQSHPTSPELELTYEV